MIPSLSLVHYKVRPLTSVLETRIFTLSVGASNTSIEGGAGNDTFVVTTSNLLTSSTIAGGAGMTP